MTAVRSALAGLTMRGRSMLACGLALVVWAVTLGQADFLRIAVFLLALPLVAAVAVTRTRYRLSCTRGLDPPSLQVGSTTTVNIRLDNVSSLPSSSLLIEDTLPPSLGRRPRFIVDRIEAGTGRDITYALHPQERGRHRIGPLAVLLTDPFGICELSRQFTTGSDLVVHPTVWSLPSVRLGTQRVGGGDVASRSVVAGGSGDGSTRQYRRGDDLRKVHWRSTARVGELMVRREEQPAQSRATLLLDGRAGAHRGSGGQSSYEWSVSAVASVGVVLARAGYALELVDDTGTRIGDGVPLTESALLDTLADVATSQASVQMSSRHLRQGADELLVAVLGALDASLADDLAGLRRGTGTCIAILLDTNSWAPAGAGAQAAYRASATRLAAAGWRVLPIARGEQLASVWPMAGRGAVSTVRPPVAASA